LEKKLSDSPDFVSNRSSPIRLRVDVLFGDFREQLVQRVFPFSSLLFGGDDQLPVFDSEINGRVLGQVQLGDKPCRDSKPNAVAPFPEIASMFLRY